MIDILATGSRAWLTKQLKSKKPERLESLLRNGTKMYARSTASCREELQVIGRNAGKRNAKDRLPFEESKESHNSNEENWQRARVLGYHERREWKPSSSEGEGGGGRTWGWVHSCGKLNKESQMTAKMPVTKKRGRTRRSGEIASVLEREDKGAGRDHTNPLSVTWRQGNVIMMVR